MKFFLNKQKGFTLVELMVVVGIIAILSSVLYANFNQARMIARDKTRMTTLKQVQLALEVYKTQYGSYPLAGCGVGDGSFAGPGVATESDLTACAQNYIQGLVPEFIGALPMDPQFENDANRGYYYRSSGDSYKFMSYNSVEVNIISDLGQEFARCPIAERACLRTVHPNTYAVYSAGAQNW